MKSIYLTFEEIKAQNPGIKWTEEKAIRFYECRLVDGIRDQNGLFFHSEQLKWFFHYPGNNWNPNLFTKDEPAFQRFFRCLGSDVLVKLQAGNGPGREIQGLTEPLALQLDQHIRITRGLDGNSLHKILVSIEVFAPEIPEQSLLRYGEFSLEAQSIIFPLQNPSNNG